MNRTTFSSVIIALLFLPACHSAHKSEPPIPRGDTATIQQVIGSFEKELEDEHRSDTIGSLSAIVFIGKKSRPAGICWGKNPRP
jgi:hypothetical protein